MQDWIERLDQKFDPGTQLVTAGEKVPEIWADYLSDSPAERLFGLRRELSKVSDYFPVTTDGMAKVAVDAFLVDSPTYGLCRVIARRRLFRLFACADDLCRRATPARMDDL